MYTILAQCSDVQHIRSRVDGARRQIVQHIDMGFFSSSIPCADARACVCGSVRQQCKCTNTRVPADSSYVYAYVCIVYTYVCTSVICSHSECYVYIGKTCERSTRRVVDYNTKESNAYSVIRKQSIGDDIHFSTVFIATRNDLHLRKRELVSVFIALTKHKNTQRIANITKKNIV